jgi:hypothetical protein
MSDKNIKRAGMYWIGKKAYPSVTQILSIIDRPALRYWFGREVYRAMAINPTLSEQEAMAAPYQISETAKQRGSAVHDIVEAWENTGKVAGLEGVFSGYAKAFESWIKNNKVELVEHEKTVFSKKHRYAGTLDLLAKLNGNALPHLIDIKTGKKDLYPEVHLQLSAYEQALFETGYEKNGEKFQTVEGTAALLLMEDGTYKFETGKDKFKEFLACKKIWEGLNEDLLKKADDKMLEIADLEPDNLFSEVQE